MSIKESYKFSKDCIYYGYNPLRIINCIKEISNYHNRGIYSASISSGVELLKIFDNASRLKKYEFYEGVLHLTGVSLIMNNQPSSGLYYCELATELYKSKKGVKSKEFQIASQDCAMACIQMGDYHKARAILMEIKPYIKDKEVRKSSGIVEARLLYAEKRFAEALALLKANIDENNSRHNELLYAFRLAAGQTDGMIQELKTKIATKDSPDLNTCSILNTLAVLESQDSSTLNDAIKHGAQVEQIYQQLGMSHSTPYINALINMASFYQSAGEYEDAVGYLERALKIINQLDKNNHQTISHISSLMALNLRKAGQHEAAAAYASNYFDMRFNDIAYNMFETPERREQIWNSWGPWFLSDFPAYALQCPSDSMAMRTYDALLIGKGLLLYTEVGLKKIAFQAGQSVRDSYCRWDSLRNYLKTPMPIENRQKLIQKSEEAFVSFRNLCYDLPSVKNYFNYSWKDVSNALDQNQMAIEFFEYTDTDNNKSYGAAILSRDSNAPEITSLGIARPIDSLISFVSPDNTWDMIWKPLLPFIKDKKEIFFSGAGSLHRIPIEHFTRDIFTASRLSSTRELTNRHKKEESGRIVLFGGLIYDLDENIMVQEGNKHILPENLLAYRGSSTLPDNRGYKSIPYLEWTETEVDSVASILEKQSAFKPTVFKDAQGVEEAVFSLSGKNVGILHLATHGFYFPKEKHIRNAAWLRMFPETAPGVNDAMKRSGLLMSGASNAFIFNKVPKNSCDGILTAYEISNLDFSEMDLAVLSACQTGLGDITVDDVAGLPNAFKKAGVGSVLVSLRPVNDKATCTLMSSFYREWLLNGKSKSDALRYSIDILKYNKDNPSWNSPSIWSSFILIDGLE